MLHSHHFKLLLLCGAIAALPACGADNGDDQVMLDPETVDEVTAADSLGTNSPGTTTRDLGEITSREPGSTPPPPSLTPDPGDHETPLRRDDVPPFAIADLEATEGNQAGGEVTFTQAEDGDGVHIVARITGLQPGPHGFHIHEFGDCSAPDASSAGDHFNPDGMDHGARTDDERHVGDLGNVMAGADGVAMLDVVDETLWDAGVDSLMGKALVVHAGEDDLESQPAGMAGDRVACGVITSLAN